MKNQTDIPFNRVYLNPSYRDKSYAEIYIARTEALDSAAPEGVSIDYRE